MIPAQKVLSKIIWDENLDQDDFSIGIYDRVKDKIFYMKFTDLEIDKNDKFSFITEDDNGNVSHIPFHRIRIILERGKVFWERTSK